MKSSTSDVNSCRLVSNDHEMCYPISKTIEARFVKGFVEILGQEIHPCKTTFQ